jgi:hypothetical protein
MELDYRVLAENLIPRRPNKSGKTLQEEDPVYAVPTISEKRSLQESVLAAGS